MMTRLALSVVLGLSACTGTQEIAGPPTADALRAGCKALTAESPGDFVPLESVTARVAPDGVDAVLGLHGGTDDFATAARGAESLWHYDSSSQIMGGMRTGETGLIAVTGCAIVGQQTHIIFN